MKIPSILFLAIWFYAFTTQISQKPIDIKPNKIVKKVFQSILDSADVQGSILIYDLRDDTYYSNNFEWAEKAFIPASTFKIPNTLIAIENGIAEDENSIQKWDGNIRSIDNWNQDLTLKQAFHYSCVPCYQAIAKKVGVETMEVFTDKLGFGNMDVNEENLDVFWLFGDSKISQYEEIEFLKRFYHSELPISERTDKIAKKMMISEVGNGYKILSKTGWSSSGVWWYVGYVETEENTYFFATNLEYKDTLDPAVRTQVTKLALEHLEIVPSNRP